MIADAGRVRVQEMHRLMGYPGARATAGRPPADRVPAQADRRFDCAERRLSGELSESRAALFYGVDASTVRRWVAWCLAPANDDPRADRCRALAGRGGGPRPRPDA
jgi:hypothetical protein